MRVEGNQIGCEAERRNSRERPCRAIAAATRLEIDGAHSDDAVRRRIRWLAHERKLPTVEIEKAMSCRVDYLAEFGQR